MAFKFCKIQFKREQKHDYIVWKEFYWCLVAFMVAMLFLSATQITIVTMFLVESHLAQIIELSFIKSEQIFSNMLAEMK